MVALFAQSLSTAPMDTLQVMRRGRAGAGQQFDQGLRRASIDRALQPRLGRDLLFPSMK